MPTVRKASDDLTTTMHEKLRRTIQPLNIVKTLTVEMGVIPLLCVYYVGVSLLVALGLWVSVRTWHPR